MPISIIVIGLLIFGYFLFKYIKKNERAKSMKLSWLMNLVIGDKARVEIPSDQLIFGKVTKIEKDEAYFTVEYRIKKEHIQPPFNI